MIDKQHDIICDSINATKTETSLNTKGLEIYQAIIICVELTSTIFKPVTDINNKVQLLEILDSIMELMEQLIIVAPNTAIGCYLFHSKNTSSRNGIQELFPLKNINITDVKNLSNLLENLKLGYIKLENQFPFNKDDSIPLYEVFSMIQTQFASNSSETLYNTKRIFFFTDNDSPEESKDEGLKLKLKSVVNILNNNFINFETFFIDYPNGTFDQSFYSHIFKINDNTKRWEYDDPDTLPISLSCLKYKVLKKKEIKQIKFRCLLILDERNDFIISVKGYSIITHEKPETRYKLLYEKNGLKKEVSTRRKYVDSETGTVITNNIIKVYYYNNKYIELSDSEYEQIHKNYSKYEMFLKLIYFTDTSQCVLYYNNIGRTYFVIPDDSLYEGSIKTMSSMYKNLKSKNKSAIVWGKLKHNSLPAIFALTPTSENDINEGFYLIRLPFTDEIRKLPLMPFHKDSLNLESYETICQITENIVQYFNLEKGYTPMDFKNPMIQKHYCSLYAHISKARIKHLKSEDNIIQQLQKLNHKIIESATSDNKDMQNLSKYIDLWNKFYEEYNKNPIGKQPKRKKYRKT